MTNSIHETMRCPICGESSPINPDNALVWESGIMAGGVTLPPDHETCLRAVERALAYVRGGEGKHSPHQEDSQKCLCPRCVLGKLQLGRALDAKGGQPEQR